MYILKNSIKCKQVCAADILSRHHFQMHFCRHFKGLQCRLAQLVTCLTADPGVASSVPAWSHTFVEIDHEIVSTVVLLASTDSRRVVVSYKRKYVHEVLVNRLVKLAQEKKCGKVN